MSTKAATRTKAARGRKGRVAPQRRRNVTAKVQSKTAPLDELLAEAEALRKKEPEAPAGFQFGPTDEQRRAVMELEHLLDKLILDTPHEFRCRPFTTEELIGLECAPYFRWSSGPQEWGSTLERQQFDCSRVIEGFKLKERPDWVYIDAGVKASNAANRIRGAMRRMIGDMVSGKIPQRRPVVVSSIDRMVRDFPGIAETFLTKLVEAGFPIIEGDGTVWDWDTIIRHKLTLSQKVSAAYQKAHLQRGYTCGANAKKHVVMSDYNNEDDQEGELPIWENPDYIKPWIMSPLWLVREGNKKQTETIRYVLSKDTTMAQTIVKIFELFVNDGKAKRAIAEWLNLPENKKLYPYFGDKRGRVVTKWTPSRIHLILTDEAVVGWYNCDYSRLNGHALQKLGKLRVKIFPPIVKQSIFDAAQSRIKIKKPEKSGPNAGVHINLFTGKMECVCGEKLTATHGKYTCYDRYTNATPCEAPDYRLSYFEPLILLAMARYAAPDQDGRIAAAESKLDTAKRKRNAAKKHADNLNKSLAIQSSKSLINAVSTAHGEVDRLDAEVEEARKALSNIKASVDSFGHIHEWLDEYRIPAMKGDATARGMLRDYLSTLDFKIKGLMNGGMVLTMGGYKQTIHKPDPKFLPYRNPPVKGRGFREKRRKQNPPIGTVDVINGVRRRYVGKGCWTPHLPPVEGADDWLRKRERKQKQDWTARKRTPAEEVQQQVQDATATVGHYEWLHEQKREYGAKYFAKPSAKKASTNRQRVRREKSKAARRAAGEIVRDRHTPTPEVIAEWQRLYKEEGLSCPEIGRRKENLKWRQPVILFHLKRAGYVPPNPRARKQFQERLEREKRQKRR